MNKNELKYGKQSEDVIAQKFAIHPLCGLAFCLGNVDKYLTRHTNEGSEKFGLPENITKSIDYVNRCFDAGVISEMEHEGFIEAIQTGKYNLAIVLAKGILKNNFKYISYE